jgi:signal transduction histidine kinase
MRMLSKLNGIAARIAIAIVLAIIMLVLVGILLSAGYAYFRGERVLVRFSRSGVGAINLHRNQMILSGKVATIIRAVASSPRPERPWLAAALSEPGMRISLDAPAVSESAGSTRNVSLDEFRDLIQMQLDEAALPFLVSVRQVPVSQDRLADLHLASPASGERIMDVVFPDGQRMDISLPDAPTTGGAGWVVILCALTLVAIPIAFLTARLLASPIRDFASGAERLGVDLTAPPLAVRGPQELRMATTAFNRMQDRLRRFLEDRTQMLAAISHDLRAPLARLRLRAELVADGEQQRKMFDDLDVMNAMIDSTLAFARDDSRQEPRRLVDLGVLVGDICEDVADAGGRVAYVGPRGVDVPCRPTLVRRAVANLIDNAIKYGAVARVKIVCDSDRVAIIADDDGPGIPVEEQEKVFAPFYRLDARDPGKAGVGLGLSVARTVAREHGGDVTLKNRDNGGLSALIALPA